MNYSAEDQKRLTIEWLREGLNKQGKTQTGLADHCGIAKQSITKWLSKGTIAKKNFIPAAEYLEQRIEPWMLGGDASNNLLEVSSRTEVVTTRMTEADRRRIVAASMRMRKKMVHSIIYFCEHTKTLGKTKLFKLLFFLDFECFRQTGENVSGMDYHAWRFGPVPTSLYEEFDCLEPDLRQAITITPMPTTSGEMLSVNATGNVKFDGGLFSSEELKILNEVAEEFQSSNAADMVEATHFDDGPWHRVYEIEMNERGLIPYDYALP